MKRVKVLSILILGLALCIPWTSTAVCAEYPTKPIEIFTPYGAGGQADLAARILASAAHTYIGQPVVVINKGGAGGAVACTYIKNAKPDGYSLLLARLGSNIILPALNERVAFKYNDFTMLTLLEFNPWVILVRTDSPFKTLKDLADHLKNKPGTLSYSTSGPLGLDNLGVLLFMDLVGAEKTAATMIPYKSGGESTTALLGGHVDFEGTSTSPVMSHIQGGKLRALAVTGDTRLERLPEVPTFKELGYPEMASLLSWSALFGPPHLPKVVVDAWEKAMKGIQKDPTWLKLTKQLGSIPKVTSPAETRAFMDEQFKLYLSLGRKHGLLVK
jgi:tripartite-type tricarboxylate transporter receptor subunit TctC